MNAKIEFTEHCIDKTIKCAVVHYEKYGKLITVALKLNSDETAFLEQLDFNYDNGWGCQVVTGCIWFMDGTWSEHAEYDGSEWWQHHSCPAIPEICI